MSEKRIKPKNKFQKFLDKHINKVIISSIGLIILFAGYLSGSLVFSLNYPDDKIADDSQIYTEIETETSESKDKKKQNGTIIEEEIEYIQYDVQETIDNSMYEDEIIVENKGKFGEKLLKYKVKIVNGKRTKRKLISETVKKGPEDRIVTVGSKKRNIVNIKTIEETVTESFETIYINDDTKEVGFKEIETKGIPGEKIVTIEITYTNGRETDRTEIDSILIKEPITEVIIKGTKNSGSGNSGNEDPGNEDPENEDPGNEDPGNEDPGSEDPGNEDPGNEDPGNEDPGSENPGNEDPGSENP